MAVKDEIEDRLTADFHPSVLEVVNESHRHAGHAGDDGSGESHFHITIRAEALKGMTRVARHRAVQAALGDLNSRIHATGLDIGLGRASAIAERSVRDFKDLTHRATMCFGWASVGTGNGTAIHPSALIL